MKKTFKNKLTYILGMIALAIILNFSITQAAPDSELTYHGKLTDTSNVAVSDGDYDFKLTIYDAESGGNCLWTSRGTCGTPTSKTLTITNGIFSTTLGETGDNVLDISFDSNYYLGVTISSNPEMTPRRKITPTGFALNSHRFNGFTADNYIDTSNSIQNKTGGLALGDDFTVNTNDFFVDTANGRVGIGTNTPSTYLDVEIDQAGPMLLANFNNINTDATSFSEINVKAKGNSTLRMGVTNDLYAGWAGGSFIFSTHPNGRLALGAANTEDLTILPSGNVGIGTTNPVVDLQIGSSGTTSTSTPSTISLGGSYSDTAGTNLKLQLYTDGFNPIGLGVSDSQLDFVARSTDDFVFYASGSELIRIDGNTGNMGIGTSSPNSLLHVGDGTDAPYIPATAYVSGGAGTNLAIRDSINNVELLNYVYDGGGIIGTTTDDNLYIRTNNTDRITILNSGNVGIGITTPTHTLDNLNGSTRFGGYSQETKVVSVNDTTYHTLLHTDGTTLKVSYQYRIALNTTGTGSDTGAQYLVWHDADTLLWNVRYISRAGTGSNHPEIFVDSGVPKVKTSHATLYSIRVNTDAYWIQDADAVPTFLGSDYHWQRDVNNLSYLDGNVGIGTLAPNRPLEISSGRGTAYGLSITDSGDLNNDRVVLRTSNVGHGLIDMYNDTETKTVSIASVAGTYTYFNADNIGIGTVAPGAQLTLMGDTDNGADSGRIRFEEHQGGAYIDLRHDGSANKFNIYSSNLGRNILSMNRTYGLVGIGTDYADSKLEIRDDTDSLANKLLFVAQNPITTEATSDTAWIRGETSGTALKVDNFGSGNGLIVGNGNVGIGTTNPLASLDVNGSVRFTGTVGNTIFDGTGARMQFTRNSANYITASDVLGSLRLGAGGVEDLLTIAASGNIGIGAGVIAPPAPLSIGDNSYSSATAEAAPSLALQFDGTYDNSGYTTTNKITLLDSNSWRGGIGISEGDFDLFSGAHFKFYTGHTPTVQGIEALTILNSGNVGIGMSNPTQKLYIQDNVINGTKQSTYSDQNATITGNGTYYNIAMTADSVKTVSSGITDSGYVMGADAMGRLLGAGTLAESYGLRTLSGIASTGTGIVNTAFGVRSRVLNLGTGTINNGYGLYIDDVQATNDYGIYQSGVTDANFFAGDVGIGMNNPSYKLQVMGGVVPGLDDTFNLGTTDLRWQDLYLSSNSLHIGENGNEGIISYDTTNESFNFDKAAVFGTSTNAVAGMIRYESNDFEGYDGTSWNSLTSSGGASTYTGLTDTPASLSANQIQFTNSVGNAITQNSNFTYDGNNLAIGGSITLNNDASACDASKEGAMRYNDTAKVMEFCNGTEWGAFSTDSGSSNSTYTSPEQIITSGGALTLAHGLSEEPKFIQTYLVNQTAELGYSVGEKVFISIAEYDQSRGTSITADDTNIYIRYGNDVNSVFPVIAKTNGSIAHINNANWTFVVNASTGIGGSTSGGGGIASIQTFDTAGAHTWTKPVGIETIRVQVVGAGGGAGGGDSHYGAGGAGGYSEKIIDVSSLDTVSVTVGVAGAAGSIGGVGTSGSTGGTTSFDTYCSATGGQGGSVESNTSGGLGGVGSGGDINLDGGNGINSSGGGTSYFGGGGAATPGKFEGQAYGSGGASLGGAGAGAGAAGAVIIYEYAGSSGASSLPTCTDGQTLSYNEISSEWECVDAAVGSGGDSIDVESHLVGSMTTQTISSSTYVDVVGSEKTVNLKEGALNINWNLSGRGATTNSGFEVRVCVDDNCGGDAKSWINEGASHNTWSGTWSTNVTAGDYVIKLQLRKTFGGDYVSDTNDSVSWFAIVNKDGSSTSGGGQAWNLMHIQDQKTTGTDGGSSSVGIQTRDLNTIVGTNEISGASLNDISGEVTLPAGTYSVNITAPLISTNRARLYLYNITDSENTLIGMNSYDGSGGSVSSLNGKFTITDTKTFDVRQYVESGASTVGLGRAVSQSPYEVYTDIRIWKIEESSGSSSSSYTPGFLYGFNLSNDSGDTDHDIYVSSGYAKDETDSKDLELATGLTKQLDATFTEGDDQGGLFSGTIANDTMYHVFLIEKDDGTTDIGFDIDINAVNLPSGFTSYRWLGYVLTNGSANIKQFQMGGDLMMWEKASEMTVPTTITTTWVQRDYSSFIPTSGVKGIMFGGNEVTTNGYSLIASADGVNTISYVARGCNTDADTQICAWGGISGDGSIVPYKNNYYFKTEGGSHNLLVHAVELDRGSTSGGSTNSPWTQTGNNIAYTSGNVGIGSNNFGTTADNILTISNSTAPTTSITDGIQLFAVDQSGSHELRVRDEAGNTTTLSPHNFSNIPGGESEELAWSYYSEKDNKSINVDMTKTVRLIEKLTGQQLIYITDITTGQEVPNLNLIDISNLPTPQKISEIEDRHKALSLQTNANIQTLQDLQLSVDENLNDIEDKFNYIEGQVNDLSLQTNANILAIETLEEIEDRMDELDGYQSDLASTVSKNSDTVLAINERFLFTTQQTQTSTRLVTTLEGLTVLDDLKVNNIQTNTLNINDNITTQDEQGNEINASSIGTATIVAGETEVVVETEFIKADSKIFVSAKDSLIYEKEYSGTTDGGDVFSVLIDKVVIPHTEEVDMDIHEHQFIIKIDDLLVDDLDIDWWIVN